jgi:hypothetical protein
MPIAYPVPEGVAMHGLVTGAFPGTGPYVVTAASDDEVRLTRNPRFEVWDEAVRPDGFPDEIVFSVVEDEAQRIAMVESGEADYLHRERALQEVFQGSETQYAGQWHVASTFTHQAWMKTDLAPFNNVKVRQALNLAIDRRHMADVYGGPPLVAVTCQILPPGFPGYEPYCPYTVDDDQGGQWKGPDLTEARRLVGESGTAGDPVVVGPWYAVSSAERDYLASVLTDLGYDVTNDQNTDPDHIAEALDAGIVQIHPWGWGADYLAPSIFFTIFTCEGSYDVINFCDPAFDRAYEKALQLQATDPSAAWEAWAAVDRMAVDLALWAPLYNAGSDFVSARVGNYQFSPTGLALFDQMWVQTASSGSPTSPSPEPSMPTAAPTTGPSSPLEGTWATPQTTCAEQNVAVGAAGFTAEQMALGGWSLTCADEPPHGSQFTILFEAGRLLQYADGYLRWEGDYRIVDEDTFEAGDNGTYYITYQYAIDGDRLTIDMTQDDCRPCTPGDLMGERIAQTVIYETSPFTKQP